MHILECDIHTIHSKPLCYNQSINGYQFIAFKRLSITFEASTSDFNKIGLLIFSLVNESDGICSY